MTPTRQSVRWLASEIGIRRELLLAVDADITQFYKPFPLRRRGKTARTIDRPIGVLKFIQKAIKTKLLVDFPFPEGMHGCVRECSPLTNARAHRKTSLLVNLDVSGFYPSVTNSMVHVVWSQVFGFGPQIAGILTRLTTYKGHLPQGAPTSGFLANIVLIPVVDAAKKIASDFGCEVTFYVDDISVSGRRAREVIEPLIAVLHARCFAVGRDKTEVMAPDQAQMLTGYTINGGCPSVPQWRRDRVREMIHELRIRRRLGHDYAKLLRSIDGHIAHIARTNVGNAHRLATYLSRER